ncbi:MAG: MDR/zinc-dependent alcohol dehydrogenase-like family protein [Thermoleophilia bacterium]
MKALVFQDGRLVFDPDHPDPEPAADEALVRVTVAGICATDLEIARGYMGFNGIPGHEFVGVVEAAANSDLNGRRVVAEINCGCGECASCRSGLERHCPRRTVLGILGRDGAFAGYLALPAANLHPLPDTVSDDEAVFVEPLAAAFEIVEQLEIDESDSVCVLGDGRLGLLAAQVLARYTSSLLAVGRHPAKLGILRARGIDTADAAAPGARFDIVVDCTGAAEGLSEAASLVKPRGTIVLKTTVAGSRTFDLNQLVIDEVTLLGSRCGPFAPAIDALSWGQVDVKPLIDRRFPLEDGLAAFEYAAKPGSLKVLITTS